MALKDIFNTTGESFRVQVMHPGTLASKQGCLSLEPAVASTDAATVERPAEELRPYSGHEHAVSKLKKEPGRADWPVDQAEIRAVTDLLELLHAGSPPADPGHSVGEPLVVEFFRTSDTGREGKHAGRMDAFPWSEYSPTGSLRRSSMEDWGKSPAEHDASIAKLYFAQTDDPLEQLRSGSLPAKLSWYELSEAPPRDDCLARRLGAVLTPPEKRGRSGRRSAGEREPPGEASPEDRLLGVKEGVRRGLMQGLLPESVQQLVRTAINTIDEIRPSARRLRCEVRDVLFGPDRQLWLQPRYEREIDWWLGYLASLAGVDAMAEPAAELRRYLRERLVEGTAGSLTDAARLAWPLFDLDLGIGDRDGTEDLLIDLLDRLGSLAPQLLTRRVIIAVARFPAHHDPLAYPRLRRRMAEDPAVRQIDVPMIAAAIRRG